MTTTGQQPETLTPRQRDVLTLLCGYHLENEAPATIRWLVEQLGLRSNNGVQGHMVALKRKGYITLQHGQARTIRVLVPPPGFVKLPGGGCVGEEQAREVVRMLTAWLVQRQGERLTPQVRAARLAGYDGIPCPRCASLKSVCSGGQCACDACGERWTR